MSIHYLNDFPYQYTTSDNVVVSNELAAPDWHNDPNHNVEPKSTKSREIPLTLDEYNKAGKTHSLVEKLTNTYESGKRVERFFLSQQGQVWLVWHITDIPEVSDSAEYAHIVRDGWGFTAKDANVTVVTASLFFTHDRAMQHIQDSVSDLAKYANGADGEFYSHVYELGQM